MKMPNRGTNQSLCRSCGRLFTSVSGFDSHLGPPSDPTCYDPADKGMVYDEKRQMWKFRGRPGGWWDQKEND